MKITCTKEEQEKLVEILSNTQETLTLSIIEWEIIDELIDNAPTVKTTKRKKTKNVVKRVDGTDWDSFED